MEAVERAQASAIALRLRAAPHGVRVQWDIATPLGGRRAIRLLEPVLYLVRGLTSYSRIGICGDRLVLEFSHGD